jgi:protein ImuA
LLSDHSYSYTMSLDKSHIIAQLQKEILPLQGFRALSNGVAPDMGLGPIRSAFPNGTFPLGAIHEFICTAIEDTAATAGFISGLLSTLMRTNGALLWIGTSRLLFPPALRSFNIEPDRIIFIDLHKERDVVWAMEEALKCVGLAAVVAELQELSFTTSRRLQLAVEQSRVTGFIIRRNPRNTGTTACVTRWEIKSLPSTIEDEMPGVGFPRWNVQLLKIRNGKPGTWEVEWKAGRFRHPARLTALPLERKKKTG